MHSTQHEFQNLTDDIFDASDPDVRDSSRGRTDSSYISRALLPHPTVNANKPIKETIKIEVKKICPKKEVKWPHKKKNDRI